MIIVFGVTLAAGVVSKGATFFMINQVSSSDNVFIEGTMTPKKAIVACNSSFNQISVGEYAMVWATATEKVAWLWAIFFSFIAPEFFTLIRCCRIVFMKSYNMPGVVEFFIVFTLETLHVLGTAILFLIALPQMDSVRAIMATNAVALIPGVSKLLMKPAQGHKKVIHLILTVISVLIQLSALIILPIIEYNKSVSLYWALPLGLLLTSFGWWECYVEEGGPLKKLWDIKTLMTDGGARGFTYFFISLWKIGLFLLCLALMAPLTNIVPEFNTLFTQFAKSFEMNEFTIQWISSLGVQEIIQQDHLVRWEKLWKSPALVLLVQIACTWITYIFGKFACKISIQRLGFALPLSLITPLCVSTLAPLCYYRVRDSCKYTSSFPKHLFFECPSMGSEGMWFFNDGAFLWLLFYLSHFWITFQIWIPKNKRLAETLQIFGTDYYNSLMIDISMMLNRRTDDGERSKRYDNRIKHFNQMKSSTAKEAEKDEPKKKRKISAWSEKNEDFVDLSKDDQTIRIMGCATMWHENTEEIEEMLKSIFRIDDDYSARRIAFQLYERSEDYYEWESHIFFDDCMARSEDEPDEMVINSFVIDLISTVDKFGRKWYGKRGFNISMTKMTTPYGGRLEWTLPGATKEKP